jgi:preprotein translocase subunit SecF
MKEKFQEVYYKHYKKLAIIPILFVILAVSILTFNYINTGDIMDKDVSLKGGTTATIYTEKQFEDLEAKLLEKFPNGDFTVRALEEFGTNTQIGIIVEVSNVDPEELKTALEEITGLTLTPDIYTVEFIGGSLGESFYRQMAIAMVLAYIFMGIVVFVAFRVPVPSFAVIFSAFGDMICTMAVLDLFGVKLSTSGIAALLLLVGYSVDTDILLTTKLLRKHEGTLFDRLLEAMKTGLTMSAASIVALGLAYLFSGSFVLQQMFLIIIIGLLFDIVMTYCMNAGLLIWYIRKRKLE